MEGRSGGDQGDVRRGQRVAVGHLYQVLEQQLRQGADMEHMEAALAVAELHNMAENIHHQAALLLLLIDLLHDKINELLLLAVEKDGVYHTAVDHPRIEGAADKVGGPQVIGPLHMGGGALRGDHHHGHIVNPTAFLHDLQHLKPVHLGHYDVKQKKRELRTVLLQRGHSGGSVLHLDDLVLLPQHLRQDCPIHLGIVCYQYLLFWRHRIPLLAIWSRPPASALPLVQPEPDVLTDRATKKRPCRKIWHDMSMSIIHPPS